MNFAYFYATCIGFDTKTPRLSWESLRSQGGIHSNPTTYWHCGSSTLERRPTWKDGLGCGTGWRWGVFLGSLLLVEEIFHLAGMCKTSHIWSKLKYCKVDIYLLLGKFYITWYMLDFVHPRWWRIVWRDDWGIRFPPSAWIFGTFTLMDLFEVVFLLFTMVNDH